MEIILSLVQFTQGKTENLPSKAEAGVIYFTTDGGIYLGLDDGTYKPYGDFYDDIEELTRLFNEHNHDAIYAKLGHNHDTVYSKLNHNHDDRYYTETEVNNLLSGKANSVHTHDVSDVTDLQTELDKKVPTSRKVNGKSLTADIVLVPSDIAGAATTTDVSNAKKEATDYTDQKIANLLNNSTEAVDSITELAKAMQDNASAIDALEAIAANHADKNHTHNNYASSVEVVGEGNAITAVSQTGNKITATKGSTFLTAHPAVSKSADDTSAVSPKHGGSFTAVDSVTRDSNGHVIKINTKTVTLPSETQLTQNEDDTAKEDLEFGKKFTAITGLSVSDHKVTDIITEFRMPSVDTVLSETSTNPVQNKVVKSALDDKSNIDHTHNYAGSVSVGGSANSAVKLDNDADAGSATHPIYFKDGKPVATNYTLNKSVPSDAKFTDTVYTHPSYSAKTGVPTANQAPNFGDTFQVTQPISDAEGHVVEMNSRTITIPKTEATTSLAGLMSAADKQKLDATNITYCTCDTAAATAEKAIVVSGNKNWKLTVGAIIMVRFSITNTASSVKLNVNGTGAYPIWYNNAEYVSTGNAYTGYANRTTTYAFNGTHWVWVSNSYDANTQSNTNSTNTSNKIFLVGATSQGSNKTTYSHDTAYVGTDGCVYSGGQKTLTVADELNADTVKTSSGNITVWKGTKAQYDAITTKDASCLYIVTDDIPVQQTWNLTMNDGTTIEKSVVVYD